MNQSKTVSTIMSKDKLDKYLIGYTYLGVHVEYSIG